VRFVFFFLGLLLLVCLPAQGSNTDAQAPLRVTLTDGATKQGVPKWKNTRLDLSGKTPAKVKYTDLAAFEDPWPPTAAHRALLAADYAKRAAKAKSGKAWSKLGVWARERGLEKEALAAFARAVKDSPQDASARAGLGQVKEGPAWQAVDDVLRARWQALLQRGLAPKGLRREVFKLSRFAAQNGAPRRALAFLARGLATDARSKQGLKQLAPLAQRYRHRVKLSFPLYGRWEASDDPTRHHSKQAGAVYALDLLAIDADGDHFHGGGRFDLKAHYAYGKPFHAAAPGRVILARDGYPDLPIGKLGKIGNTVGIDHGGGEMTWYNHAQPGSIVVKVGQDVKRGQLLGKIGNSGKSSIPHLHFALTIEGGVISVPWRVSDYELWTAEGWVKVTQACPREGWTMRFKPPAKKSEEGKGD
jgi:murein DD-endopeptidase MepM/ murein hydrolase activator NlpD